MGLDCENVVGVGMHPPFSRRKPAHQYLEKRTYRRRQIDQKNNLLSTIGIAFWAHCDTLRHTSIRAGGNGEE
jgi:hypothetical protein